MSLPLGPVLKLGALTGDVVAGYDGAEGCVPAVDGERVLSDSLVQLAGLSLLDLPVVGEVARVGASAQRSTTKLVDNGDGSSDVVSTVTTNVAPISLLDGRVQVRVTSPTARPGPHASSTRRSSRSSSGTPRSTSR